RSDASTVGESRHLAASTFKDWGMDRDQAELACLLVSEIVTNVVIHATPRPVHREFVGNGVMDSDGQSGADTDKDEFDEDWSDLLEAVSDENAAEEPVEKEFLLRLSRGANTVWVEVFDNDLRLPRIRSAAAEDEGGRGLCLVARLPTRWGSPPAPDGKAGSVEIPMHASESREDQKDSDGRGRVSGERGDLSGWTRPTAGDTRRRRRPRSRWLPTGCGSWVGVCGPRSPAVRPTSPSR